MSHGRTWCLVAAALLAATPALRADPKREVPDYDGRGNEDSEAGSWALWIPRIVLSPLYVTNEYLLRRPLGAFVTAAERGHWVNTVTQIFEFGPSDNYLILPTALFDFGLLPSVGLYLAGDDSFAKGNSIRLSAATWGPEWIAVAALDRYTWNHGETSISPRVDFRREADLLFFGIGPDVTDATQSRYGLERLDGQLSFKQMLSKESNVTLTGGIRRISYTAGDCCGDPSLDDRIADGTVATPPGYNMPYTALYQRLDVTLDTRDPRPASATGGYMQGHVETDFDVTNERSWIKVGGAVGLAVELAAQRTLRAQVAVEYVDPTKGIVPFNELATPGNDLMPGFVGGWMLGRSIFAGQVGYTWPVWLWLDGQTRFSIGNAFGPHLEDLSGGKLRLSGDIGVTTIGKRDQGFEILFGVGTETFDQGAHITSVRLTFGSRRGF